MARCGFGSTIPAARSCDLSALFFGFPVQHLLPLNDGVNGQITTDVRFRPIADISVSRQISCVSDLPIKIMRASLWLLFVAATIVAMCWMMLVLVSGFEIWRESNWAGLALQAALLLFPVGLLFAVKRSIASQSGTVATFSAAWGLVFSALLFLGVPWSQGLTSTGACTDLGCRWP